MSGAKIDGRYAGFAPTCFGETGQLCPGGCCPNFGNGILDAGLGAMESPPWGTTTSNSDVGYGGFSTAVVVTLWVR